MAFYSKKKHTMKFFIPIKNIPWRFKAIKKLLWRFFPTKNYLGGAPRIQAIPPQARVPGRLGILFEKKQVLI